MREILFRGKLLSDGRWAEGNLDIKKSGVCIITPDETPVGCYGQVDPKTVGQYTGLTDGHGKRIFEGDIVDCWSEGVNAQGTVQQRKDGLWIIYPAWQKTIMWGLCPDEYCNTTVEVIGNIHDNPEMIGGAEDGK